MKRTIKDANPGDVVYIERGLFARKTKDGETRYGISYVAPNGKRMREIVGPTVTLARKVLSVRRAEIAEGRYKFPTRRKVATVDTFAARYLEHAKQHKARSWRRDEGVLARFSALFGSKALDELTTWDVQLYQNKRAEARSERNGSETVSQACVNREVAIIKRMLALAVKWGEIEKNPAGPVELYLEQEIPIRGLTIDEERALIAACVTERVDGTTERLEPLRSIVVAALETGMRRGELFRLRWEDVDLRGRWVTVTKSKGNRVRKIPISDTLYEALSGIPGARNGYVFQRDGRQVSTVQKSFDAAVRRAGLRQLVRLPDGRRMAWPRFHDLRHTFGTVLDQEGVGMRDIQELMGHANIKTTARYVHPTPESKRAAIAKLSRRRRESDTRVAHGDSRGE